MGPAVVVTLVAVALFGLANRLRNGSTFNPVFLVAATSVLVVQFALLGLHQIRFHQADVEVVVAAQTIEPGTEISKEQVTTAVLDRADAEGAFRSTDDAIGKVAVSKITAHKVVTEAAALSYVALPLAFDVAGTAVDAQAAKNASTAGMRVDVFAAPMKTPDKPLVIEGALLDRSGERLTLRLTEADRTALLAIMARSTITIEPSED